MNIAILGSAEKLGRALIAKLLTNPDYQLTIISKTAENIFENSHRITAKSINEANLNQLTKALKDTDIVFCALSGTELPTVALNLVKINPKRVIFMTAVGIYNEIAESPGDEFNLENEPQQIPNVAAADIIEESDLNYTIIRSGFFEHGDENDYEIASKGEPARGYITTIESVEKIVLEIIEKPESYLSENISVTKA